MKTKTHVKSKLIVLFVLFNCVLQPLFAQDLIGFNYNNYMGVNGIFSNPASIAASRYKVHFNLLMVNSYAGSNAYEFSSKKLFKLQTSGWVEGQDYRKIPGSGTKNGWAQLDIMGPSVLINLNKKSAIGLTTRLRTMGNAYNLSNGSFNMLGAPIPADYGIDFNEKNVSAKMMSFADAGITYAKVLKNKGNNFIKGGLTLKYVQGISSAFLRVDELNVNIKDVSTIDKLNGIGSLVYAENIDRMTMDSANIDMKRDISMSNGALGMDIGMVYEHRSGKFTPKVGNIKSLYRTIPYDFRFSISITDFGLSALKFKAGKESARYTLTADNVEIDTFNMSSQQSAADYLAKLQTDSLLRKQATTGEFDMPLPTSLHANFDWHVTQNVFINADALVSFSGGGSKNSGSNYISTISVTPRFETQWFSIYSPVSVNVQKELNWGIGFRLGPLFAGSGSVLSNVLKTNLRNIDAHVGLTVPLYQGKHVKKKKEKPVEKPVPVVTKAVVKFPIKVNDRDKDCIPDEIDACPDVPGYEKYNGCLDTDKDGIPDNLDLCPAATGSIRYNGCPVPDKDDDGVTDEKDKCPNKAGPVTNSGCPVIKEEVKKTVDKVAKNIFFAFHSTKLDRLSYPSLNKLADLLKADKTLFLDIEGHTDNVGTHARNMAVSQQRADAAKQYLVNKGVAKDRITSYGFAETRPVGPNNTEANRAKNRRIVLKIRNF